LLIEQGNGGLTQDSVALCFQMRVVDKTMNRQERQGRRGKKEERRKRYIIFTALLISSMNCESFRFGFDVKPTFVETFHETSLR
jgi:hypothetical protein